MKRVARLERTCQVDRDWRQFGDDPRDMPDWALVASMLWHYEQYPALSDNPDLKEARRFYDAGQVDAASSLLDDLLNGAEAEAGNSVGLLPDSVSGRDGCT